MHQDRRDGDDRCRVVVMISNEVGENVVMMGVGEAMFAYDNLPRQMRQFLSNAPFNFDAVGLFKQWQVAQQRGFGAAMFCHVMLPHMYKAIEEIRQEWTL